ncbi:hypothetical protein K3495_g3327 [Podosphaera aphanis]|nr:hypothetical protein K3495_g3327 [Podosphaera aphanis]
MTSQNRCVDDPRSKLTAQALASERWCAGSFVAAPKQPSIEATEKITSEREDKVSRGGSQTSSPRTRVKGWDEGEVTKAVERAPKSSSAVGPRR